MKITYYYYYYYYYHFDNIIIVGERQGEMNFVLKRIEYVCMYHVTMYIGSSIGMNPGEIGTPLGACSRY